MHRCYRLWNSTKRVIIVPFLSIPACFVLWVIGFLSSLGKVSIVNTQIYFFIAALTQNLYLSGMIAGRIWWLNRRIKKVVGPPSRDLLGPVLESAALTPIFFVLWLASYFDNFFGGPVLSPYALTQIVGIASSLVVVRIGLGIDALATLQTYPVRETGDIENRAFGRVTTKNLEQCNASAADGTCSRSIQPFELQYEHRMADGQTLTKIVQNDGSRRSESIRPFQLKYYAAGHPENQASGSNDMGRSGGIHVEYGEMVGLNP
ncbi:hypothetical protein EV368DRAFT_82020 [Lentinula lateritia]|uniref:Uncharacterized protein n=1 Tax=Lentinula aff. lateritia TaxID=2804960 RepID=A0ACC1U1D0_9AGAR|nr:hypothetical protein F5876DRAFT_76477 [Lentinula aff. lateritia]KAJ3852961.1 hypothetical protein EV368DRAFT_82020 [Lentinula lateritia]